MKILYISSAQSLGGGERHLGDLANGMAQRGHEVFVALRPASPLIQELKNLRKENLTTLPMRNALDAKSARDLSKLVTGKGIQIVHAHMARDYTLAAYATRKNPHAKLIVTRHVLFSLNPLHRITLGRAARVIAVSQAVASQLSKSNIAAPEKITVVHNGVDTARFAIARNRFDRSQFLRNWELPEDSLLAGTVGELTPLKGQAEFLKAAAQVVQHHPNAYFVIAGTDNSSDKTNGAALEDLILRLKLKERVLSVPWMDDIAQLYCGLDVFVSASHTESFGLAIAEAMACSTAVVATATGGVTELVQPNETGLLVQVGDVDDLAEAMLDLLGDKEKRVRLGRAAQQAIASKFTITRMLDNTERIYREELETTATE
ncbi:MAG TPA: glycosyltransferase family 4 protein [Pyrinomonadaceae bacterium]|nr:glycosyltransferase family 4 protein [Pyrinomonadaceae bacterium]